ncbi:hypothetical protein TRFO_08968 [Tritrichomonas foetus]|uniref:RING-type domain-containing protein n=1 Tax=Tritrichomonas foetus TaxID=1144522 RepID=A0A1J4JLC8_9EUKA|nr:hypothetical protein TRFO_08968 [Tritrichomonas foetus]|eukprot:OHS98371.1 hypothetical protein TRFO_08968 [Tritrichomonas foetus]
MGITTSSVTPKRNQNECLHGIYHKEKYRWTEGQIAANIRKGKVTPIYPFSAESQRTSRCFCSICYNYYPSINETTCCQQGICTECLAAIIDPPPKQRMCPYCRSANISIKPNVEYNDLKSPVVNTHEPLTLDDSFANLPDELICLLLQYEHLDRQMVIDLYNAGVPIDEIEASLK